MFTIYGENLTSTFPAILSLIDINGITHETVTGPRRAMTEPVTLIHEKPLERVMFHPALDLNPFAMFFDSMWSLAGRNDVAFMAQFDKGVAELSWDGQEIEGASGARWRTRWGDQLRIIGQTIRDEHLDPWPQVLAMWDQSTDTDPQSSPTATHAFVMSNHLGAIDMVISCPVLNVFNLPYLARFSHAQEYIARLAAAPVGRMWVQTAMLYFMDTPADRAIINGVVERDINPYQDGSVTPFPLMTVMPEVWEQDLGVFMNDGPIIGFRDPFFRRVVTPMWRAWQALNQNPKPHAHEMALEILDQNLKSDWMLAASQWVTQQWKGGR